jgi:UDP-N-acetylglucosamine--N-acetylmuramyl-(pentapeptide) pyrophosphoryl-undecaprenol N-acetylglucosamine transferase
VSGERFALVAGGGTAGHLQPAVAIAEALVAAGHPQNSIEFVGSERGQDRVTLEGRGFPFTLLPGRGIVRSLRPADLRANLGAAIGLASAAFRGFGVVMRSQPRVVVSVGGYASLSASLAAVVLGVPLVLVNIDAVPGAANRLFGRFARASAVGWEGTPLPRAVVTGTPVRGEINGVRRTPESCRRARRALGLPEGVATVVVFGGSLGARRLNQAASGLADAWGERADRSVYHIVGRREWDQYDPVGQDAPPAGGPFVLRVPYESRMDLVYSAADVVVCRAGAMTVAELAVAGVPSILVPLPGAPGDHQTANARVLSGAGAAVLVTDEACQGTSLAVTLDGMLDDPSELAAMGRAASSLGRRDAAAAGAAVIEGNARPPWGRTRP